MLTTGRGLAIVEAEVAVLTTSMKRGHLWSSRSNEILHPSLLQPFLALKKILASPEIKSLDDLGDANIYLSPFLDVIRSEVVTGPVTGFALAAVNKFLAYGLLHESQPNVASAVENLADAVTHARFVGVDPSSDEIVLMKIMEVLRTLMLSPVGLLLTNESVCEIMQSTFRICFETRLSELLRKAAERSLNDMIQRLFQRLPTFTEDHLPLLKRLKMRSSHLDSKAKKKSGQTRPRPTTAAATATPRQAQGSTPVNKASTTDATPKAQTPLPRSQSMASSVSEAGINEESQQPTSLPTSEAKFSVDTDVLARSPIGSVSDLTASSIDEGASEAQPKEPTNQDSDTPAQTASGPASIIVTSPNGTEHVDKPSEPEVIEVSEEDKEEHAEFVNSQGVTFTPTSNMVDESGSLVPYGLPCVRELFRFLVSLINPHDNHNQDSMIQIALSLLSTALETGADHLDKFESLLCLVKDELARNLTSLLSTERISIFSMTLWISYLMFESQRRHLKYQLEIFLNKLNECVCSESPKVTYEHKELALEIIVRFYRIPGFLTQLYLNFDCDMYTSNIFEDLTKMLSKNAFPVTGLYSTHFLSLDALMTVVDSIEAHCQQRITPGITEGKDTSDSDRDPDDRDQSGSPKSRAPKIPSHEEVMALKHRKKLITTATEQFNAKPAKGITYMQECGLVKDASSIAEVTQFIRQNPHLCKKQIGEFISNRKNLKYLESFVQSFDFVGLRVDESLRQFLEAFRLPGEAPLISLIVEHFADHWHKSNGNEQITDADAAFTLAYAVIMLNVDQHNKNHTKVNDPMTEEQFKKNLRGTNGGKDHDQEMLKEIYHAIRNEEIVMPAEQTGLVKENYLWKCVLRRGQEENSELLLAPNGFFDHDLFSIIWGPSVAALSYVFDKSQVDADTDRVIAGFQKCAMIAAHYDMNDVFDNLIISLCKFSTLPTASEPPYQFIPIFGANRKALLATKTVFTLVQRHGDILRAGWKNVTECLLQLFKCQLLPKSLMEAEDYIESSGRVKLYREESQAAKVEPGFLNSFVSFISMSSESQQRIRTPEEEEFAKLAAKSIKECNIEALVTESKFYLAESLQQLVKFLTTEVQVEEEDSQHMQLFFLELLVRITIQNRDRVLIIWREVSDRLAILINSSKGKDKQFLLERSVTALLRLAVRLSRKEDLASTVTQSLKLLLAMPPNLIFTVCRHVAFGLHELLRNNAANIHESDDWSIIFTLIEVVGAGANPNVSTNQPPVNEGRVALDEDSGHGASSESENPSRGSSPHLGASRPRSESMSSGGWIVLGNADLNNGSEAAPEGNINLNRLVVVNPRPIVMHDYMSFLKCCDSLAFLIRDVAHVTPHNFQFCVQALRTFVEASFISRETTPRTQAMSSPNRREARSHSKATPAGRAPPIRKARTAPSHNRDTAADYDADESDNDQPDLSSEYHHVALQLLDLMHTLHNRAGQIYESWHEESSQNGDAVVKEALPEDFSLWTVAWCPLLQGMARLCCDKRSHIRTQALTTLQRALLFQDLQALSPAEWESAFSMVLFPMLKQLLIKSNPGEKTAMEETRMRAATLLGKVLLQHLIPLSSRPSFPVLWLSVLDFMQKFMSVANSDLLTDAVPESLKNMLLVMDTSRLFFDDHGQPTSLCTNTKEKLQQFLPNLMDEVFVDRRRDKVEAPSVVPQGSEMNQVPSSEAATVPGPGPGPGPPPPLTLPVMPGPLPRGPVSPTSPMDPPILPSSAFTQLSKSEEASPSSPVGSPDPGASFKVGAPPPLPSSSIMNSTAVGSPKHQVNIPSLPEIAPLPPPPVLPPLSGGFQPIQSAGPPASTVVVANPTPVVPTVGLSNYFGQGQGQSSGPLAGNILTQSFMPTLTNQTNPIIMTSKSDNSNDDGNK